MSLLKPFITFQYKIQICNIEDDLASAHNVNNVDVPSTEELEARIREVKDQEEQKYQVCPTKQIENWCCRGDTFQATLCHASDILCFRNVLKSYLAFSIPTF